jgi:soluble lytic murein transglycosylase-like protein
VQRQDSQSIYRSVPPRPGRENLRGLLRKPAVQLLLVATVAAQAISVSAPRMMGSSEPVSAFAMAPVVVTRAAGEAVGTSWYSRAVARESRRLASEYTRKGYEVSGQLARDIHEAAVANGIDPALAFGLVRAESSFRNSATSHVGAVGLTQLMPRTAAWMEPGVTRRELRDPDTNLRIGFKYLRYLLDKYEGDTRLALLAYNRGPGTVDRVLKRGGNPDNGYVEMVFGE